MNLWCEEGHFNLNQSEYFKSLVEKIDPKYVLETGFCTGRSAYSILSTASSLKKMISIDNNFDYNIKYGRMYRDLLTKKFSTFSTISDSSSNVFNKQFFETEFPDGIDWFTVDGDHSYNGCLHDLETAYKYINKGGIAIVDDYKSGPPDGCHIQEVTDACDTFYKNHPEITKNEWNNNGKGFCIFYF